MKKICFCLQTMILGGVEKELITILERIDKKQFDVDLVLGYVQDENMLKEIPKYVNIKILNIYKDYYCTGLKDAIIQRVKRKRFFESIKIFVKRLYGVPVPLSIDFSKIEQLNEEYDVAICFHVHSPVILRYVIEKIKAKKKVAWIHNDFLKNGFPIKRYDKLLYKYDKFVAVSNRIRDAFNKATRNYANKTETIHNIIDEQKILQLSKEIIEDKYFTDERVKILSIGRLSAQKGFDIAINACANLKKQGYKFVWYVMGEGEERQNLEKLIKEKDVADCFFLLGAKSNPYSYLRDCYLYCQTSNHEAFCLCLAEAKVLNNVIVCTNFAGASEQVENDVTGCITPVGDYNMIAKKIAELIDNNDLYTRLKSNVKYTHGQEWDRMLEIFNGRI